MKQAIRNLTLLPVALALLAGCGGAGAAVPPVATSPQASTQSVAGEGQRVADPLMGSEVLTATHVAIESSKWGGYHCNPNRGVCPLFEMVSAWKATFKAEGSASGPLPGTFSATGAWTSSITGWTFRETFTIKSGASRVSDAIAGGAGLGVAHLSFGHNAEFGPYAFAYSSGVTADTRAVVRIIKRDAFSETLDEFPN
jgi:hypothetical protein